MPRWPKASVRAAPTKSCRRRPSRPIASWRAPLQFGPDSVWNYEVGEKARMFDSWLTVNSDFYYIKWNDIQQVFTLPCGYQFYDNAGDGRSFGPELEINAKLADDWTATFSGAYTDAKLTHPNATYTSLPRQRRSPSRTA